MQEDDRATLQALTERRAVFAAQVASCEGRIVNAPGDSVLAEFPSVVNAVECAVNVQRAIAESNAGLPESRRMQYRIGVNLGDVLVDATGIYGASALTTNKKGRTRDLLVLAAAQLALQT